MKLTSQIFNNTDESLRNERRLLLLLDNLLVRLHSFTLIHVKSLVKQVNFFKARKRTSKNVELLSSVFLFNCIIVVFQNIFSTFTTCSVTVIRITCFL